MRVNLVEHREQFDVAVCDCRFALIVGALHSVRESWWRLDCDENQSGLEEIESASKAVEILGGEAMSYQEVQSIGPDGNLRLL